MHENSLLGIHGWAWDSIILLAVALISCWFGDVASMLVVAIRPQRAEGLSGLVLPSRHLEEWLFLKANCVVSVTVLAVICYGTLSAFPRYALLCISVLAMIIFIVIFLMQLPMRSDVKRSPSRASGPYLMWDEHTAELLEDYARFGTGWLFVEGKMRRPNKLKGNRIPSTIGQTRGMRKKGESELSRRSREFEKSVEVASRQYPIGAMERERMQLVVSRVRKIFAEVSGES